MTTSTRGRRARAALTALALAAGLGLVAAAPASAASATFADGVGEWRTDASSDIQAYRLSLDATSFALTFWTREPAGTTWPYNVDVDLDTNGDDVADFEGFKFGDEWIFHRADPWVQTCSGTGSHVGNQISLTVPTGCIGSPTQVSASITVVQTYGGFDKAFDSAPSSFLRAFSSPVTAGPGSGPTTSPPVTVFRFWSPTFDNAHFFTTSETEAENIYLDDRSWQYEGVAFSAVAPDGAACPDGRPVHRFYSPVFQSHFYTQDEGEKSRIIAGDRNWSYEGVAYCSFPDQRAGTVPLHRFWSPLFGKHFFTASQAETDHIRAGDRNWTYEGVAYHVIP
ncbi:hypothetical protein [Cellulomonas wangsupingiae]|uniref:hypothetical protein n=1 Tax=Cellulomonas wangsupingiae TaxID=2968085 RepID=UPI001D0E8032|nr:hypothetical protein [Cellulomonas wangsupingiae]MCM0641070.1 hypothetical protein [Cellulomonas wangsupingiae]